MFIQIKVGVAVINGNEEILLIKEKVPLIMYRFGTLLKEAVTI